MRQTELIPLAYEPDPEKVLFQKVIDVDGRIMYACPDQLWTKHLAGWRYARTAGGKQCGEVAEPFPQGHCMFERPEDYACVRWEERHNPRKLRRAHRRRTIAVLDGWDRELRQDRAGMRKLARIVRATVNAKMQGIETGGTPFLATLAAGMNHY